MVGFISFVARSVSDLDSFAVEKNPPGYKHYDPQRGHVQDEDG
jgi:hypothetical protein